MVNDNLSKYKSSVNVVLYAIESKMLFSHVEENINFRDKLLQAMLGFENRLEEKAGFSGTDRAPRKIFLSEGGKMLNVVFRMASNTERALVD